MIAPLSGHFERSGPSREERYQHVPYQQLTGRDARLSGQRLSHARRTYYSSWVAGTEVSYNPLAAGPLDHGVLAADLRIR